MKKLTLKRLAAGAMSGVLALSLASPAFAANRSVIQGAYQDVELTVVVSDAGTAIINPYGLPVMVSETKSIVGEQVVNPSPLFVQNLSMADLSVSAEVTGVEKGAFKFVNTLTASGPTILKEGVIKFQMFPTNVTSLEDPNLINEYADLKDDTEGHDTAKDITLATTAASQNDILVLRKADNGAAQVGSTALFRLKGEVQKKPTTAWTTGDSTATPAVEGDGFTANIAFTFEPSTYKAPLYGAVSSAGNVKGLASGTVELTIDTTKLPVKTPAGEGGTPAATYVTVSEWKWTSSDTAAATIAPKAGVTDKKTATVTYVADSAAADKIVTFTAEGEGDDGNIYTTSFKMVVGKLSLGDLAGTATIASGGTTTLTVPDLPDGVTVASWTWASSDSTKASVASTTTDSMVVTNAAAGTATITATGTGSDGITYTSSVEVTCS